MNIKDDFQTKMAEINILTEKNKFKHKNFKNLLPDTKMDKINSSEYYV